MSAREIIAVPVALTGLIFLFLTVAAPFLLIEQSQKDLHRLDELRRVKVYIEDQLKGNKRIPTDEELRRWASVRRMDLASSVSTAPLGCLNGFGEVPDDRYLIGFWAGEWSECLSLPSGRTTLRPSVSGLLASGSWINLGLYLTLGIGLSWAAWALGLRHRSSGR